METLRKMLPEGYRVVTGKILSAEEAERCNSVNRRINAFIKEGRKVPEELLNAAHKVFQEICVTDY